MRYYIINQQRCAFGHAPCTTARTKSAALATERHQMFSVAGIAAYSQETMFQSATFEVILEFPPDVIRQHPAFNGTLRLKSRSICPLYSLLNLNTRSTGEKMGLK